MHIIGGKTFVDPAPLCDVLPLLTMKSLEVALN